MRIGFALATFLISFSTVVSAQEWPGLEEDVEVRHEEDIVEPAVPLVDVEFDVSGSLTPGSPVIITATARALEESLPITLTIDLPEYSLVQEGYVDGQRRLEEGTRIEPVFSEDATLAPGDEMRRSATVVIEESGLYTLSVRAIADISDLRGTYPRHISDASVEEVWLFVSENGDGRVFDAPDVRLLPEGYIKALGPLRQIQDGPALRETMTGQNVNSNTATVRVGYQELGTENWTWLSNVDVVSSNHLGQSLTSRTNANGYAETLCSPGVGQSTITNVITEGVGKIWVRYKPHANHSTPVANRTENIPCGTTQVLSARWSMANTLVAMRRIEALYRNRFGRSRNYVKVYVRNDWDGGLYNWQGKIYIGEDIAHTYRGFGTMAHEYGHAFHDKALGGYARGECPGSGHFINGAYNAKCAYAEGFADFVRVVAASELLPELYNEPPTSVPSFFGVLRNSYYPADPNVSSEPNYITDGSIIEGAFAAFLWDLYDDDGTSDELDESDFDRVSYPLSWLGDVMESCRAWYGTISTSLERTDQLISCLRQQKVPYSSQFFQLAYDNGPPNYFVTHDATNPSDWSRTDIDILWKKDMFGVVPSPPPGPLSVSISGPSSCQVGQTCTWTANVSGGSGPISYYWVWRRSCLDEPLLSANPSNDDFDPEPQDVPVCEWAGGGTNQSYSLARPQTGPIDVKVTVTRGSETRSRTKYVSIVSGASLSATDSTESTSASLFAGSAIEPPDEVVLENARPNPFLSEAEIVFGLPQETGVRLAVYDLLGREVIQLVRDALPAGWHAARFDGSRLPAGVYVMRLEAGSEVISGRMTRIQ